MFLLLLTGFTIADTPNTHIWMYRGWFLPRHDRKGFEILKYCDYFIIKNKLQNSKVYVFISLHIKYIFKINYDSVFFKYFI